MNFNDKMIKIRNLFHSLFNSGNQIIVLYSVNIENYTDFNVLNNDNVQKIFNILNLINSNTPENATELYKLSLQFNNFTECITTSNEKIVEYYEKIFPREIIDVIRL